MLLSRIFKNKLQATIGVIALFMILNASLQSLLFNSEKEIHYDYSTTAFLCFKDSTSCTYLSKLKLANTGVETLNNVTVILNNTPESLETSLNIRDLNASNPRNSDPNIETNHLKNNINIKINDFTPGTLVLVKVYGQVPVASKGLLHKLNINVTSNAKVINADPQSTEFFRLISVLL